MNGPTDPKCVEAVRRNCAAVIPCHNEQGTIGDVVRGVKARLPEVWVVDDGSTDATAVRATGAGARIIRLPGNTGKGAAVTAGLRAVHAGGFAWGFMLDGDGQHGPDQIGGFLDAAVRVGEDTAMIIGNRMGDARRMPWLRRGTNRLMSALLSCRLGRPLPDTQCGYRMIRMKDWGSMTWKVRRFEVESDQIQQFIRAGRSVCFIPLDPCRADPTRPIRPSRIRPIADGWRWIHWWCRTAG